MKYVIVGTGPTGLSLAYVLARNNHEVTLIEKDSKIGGSWNSNFIEDKYFSENSPRVLAKTGYHMDFFHEIGLTANDFSNIYGNFFNTNLKLFNFVKQYFELQDYFIFAFSIIKFKFMTTKMSVQDWLNTNYMSPSAKDAIRIISITVCDVPKNTNVHDFFGSLQPVNLIQMKEPNKWHMILEHIFEGLSNVELYKNMKVIKINGSEKFASGVECVDTSSNHVHNFNAQRIVLCTQSNGILDIVQNSNSYIQNNWKSYQWLKKWCLETFYSGFGFQLHFKEIVPFPNKWCWSCTSEWTIIILPVGEWLSVKSNDPLVKTVWSCCIIDMSTKSKRLNKTANECTKDEVVQECIYQLNQIRNIPPPYKITTSVNLQKKDGKWISNNTGFTRKNMGYLNIKGNCKNLFALGCFTKPDHPEISYIKNAMGATVKFLKQYEQKSTGFHTRCEPTNKILDMFTFLILLIFIFTCTIFKNKT